MTFFTDKTAVPDDECKVCEHIPLADCNTGTCVILLKGDCPFGDVRCNAEESTCAGGPHE